MDTRSYLLALLALSCSLLPARAAAEDRSLHLAIGDPARRDREITVQVDAVTESATGDVLTPRDLARRLGGAGILFVGESHTSAECHRAELRVIQELHRAGREVLIGLEMLPYTRQEYLDRWRRGLLTEKGFVELGDWYASWSHDWRYYRDIFRFAHDAGLRMYAVNAPREVVKAVRKEGFQELTREESDHIPTEVEAPTDDYRTLFKSHFDEDDLLHMALSEEQWEGMFAAQTTWDATMGFNAVKALQEHGGEDAIMVVLIGSGHVVYGLGIQRQARQWFEGAMATLVPVPVEDEDGDPVERVQASYADFVWGLPPETDPVYPVLGLSSRAIEDEPYRSVIRVAEGSPAQRAGFQLGDILLTMDGVELTVKGALSRLVGGKSWGDSSVIGIRRGDERMELTVHFRREPTVREPAGNPVEGREKKMEEKR